MKLIRPRALAGALVLTIAAATVTGTPPALAQTYDPSYPICLQIYDEAAYIECRYTSMAQCQASAAARAATCFVNPYPAKSYAEPAAHQKRSRKY